MAGEEEGKGFTVKDRRLFSQETRDEGEAAKPPAQEQAAAANEEKKESEVRNDRGPMSYGDIPPVDFSTFVFSLNTSALVHLGVIADPTTGKKEKQLIVAKHTIDTITMLYEKTKGNLTKDEEALIEHILYDLRMRYVREA